jgi:hypothetical protein
MHASKAQGRADYFLSPYNISPVNRHRSIGLSEVTDRGGYVGIDQGRDLPVKIDARDCIDGFRDEHERRGKQIPALESFERAPPDR